MFDQFGINAGYVEELHGRWLQSPQSVEERWRAFFEGRASEGHNGASAQVGSPPGNRPAGPNGNGWAAPAAANGNGVAYREAVRETVIAATELQSRVAQLVNALPRARAPVRRRRSAGQRSGGAPRARARRTSACPRPTSTRSFSTAGMSGLPERATLRQIVAHLSETYCSSIGVEFTHIEEPEPRLWLQDSMESTRNHASLDRDGAAAHPHEAHRRRDLRAVHPQELRRRQALLARGRREHDPDARSPHRGRGRSTASKRSSSAWRTAGG